MKSFESHLIETNHLFSNSPFQVLPKENFQKLLNTKTVHHFRKGEMIYHQETPCFGLHCIESGTVKLFTQEEDGKEIISRIAKKGDLIGHTSIFCRKNYIESAKALEPVDCSFIETPLVKELLQESPVLMNEILLKMSYELYESNIKNADMVRKNVRERLAAYFIKMTHSRGNQQLPCNHFTPHLSREEIASYIGSAHETVIRCISEFKELGYINEENKTFYILNKEMLLNLSGGQLTH
jgi:CRP-like cAMP-binding protein